MKLTKLLRSMLKVATALGLTLCPQPCRGQEAQPIQAQLGSGPLSITVNGDLEFGVRMLTGLEAQYEAVAAPQVTVVDARGSGAGWVVTLQSSQLTSGPHAIPASGLSFTAQEGSIVCVHGQPISAAGPRETGQTGGLASPVRAVESGLDAGMGTYTWYPSPANFLLTVPGLTRAGTYQATLTFSVTSGP